jgi:hypothetical protein
MARNGSIQIGCGLGRYTNRGVLGPRWLPGFPDRNGTVACYEDTGGQPVTDLDWYELFAMFVRAARGLDGASASGRRDGGNHGAGTELGAGPDRDALNGPRLGGLRDRQRGALGSPRPIIPIMSRCTSLVPPPKVISRLVRAPFSSSPRSMAPSDPAVRYPLWPTTSCSSP